MKIPLHVKIRKKLRTLIQNTLSFLIKDKSSEDFIQKDEIKTIIIVRPNYRIGNLIFLTPLINELNKNIPHAKIDIIVGIKIAGDILEPLPNVQKVIDIPRKLLKQPIKLYRFIKEVRKKKYDLAINIAVTSTSSQLITSLLNSKFKASYKSDKNWAPLTHTCEQVTIYKQASLRSLGFLSLFNIELPKDNIFLDIKLTKEELSSAKSDLTSLLKKSTIPSTTKTIALFRNARFDKKISDEWWNEWHKELLKIDNNIVIIDILSPDILTKLNDNVLEYSNKNLRALGAFFNSCNMYISADTGPLHLASASKAKTLALFNKTSIKKFDTFGKKDKTININDLSPKDVAKITSEHLTS